MKKNVIFFVIDSLSYERLIDENAKDKVPFFRKLMEQNVSFSNMFSQAPYTEAALMGLICGSYTMNHNGYMMRYRDVPETFLETFSKSGYDVYQVMQPHIYPSSLERSLPNSFYNVGFDFNALWSYRLSYFSELYSVKKLEDNDYEELENMMKENFQSWRLFLTRLQNKEQSVSMILENLKEYDIEAIRTQVEKEFEKFQKEPRAYMNNLFERNQAHELFSIPTLNQNRKVCDEVREQVIRQHRPLFAEIAKKQIECDVKLDKEALSVFRNVVRDCLYNPTKENAKKVYRFMRYMKDRRNPELVLERISENYDAYKSAPSVQKHMEHFWSWFDKRNNEDKPYLAYIHVDDIHNPEVFFTYDSNDIQLVEEEMKDASTYLATLKKGYRGSVTYDLALRYMDKKLENFLNEIEKRGMLEDTVVYITADHGFSFYNHPLRETVPNNFYKESYHVPFIVVNDEIKANNTEDYHTTMDIPATILAEANIEMPKHFCGENVFESKRTYVTMEYMGGGCPDFYRRPIKYAIRNEKYSAVYSALLKDEFYEGKLEQFFDLNEDPLEKRNLVFKKRLLPKELETLLEPIRKRHEELREYYNVK